MACRADRRRDPRHLTRVLVAGCYLPVSTQLQLPTLLATDPERQRMCLARGGGGREGEHTADGPDRRDRFLVHRRRHVVRRGLCGLIWRVRGSTLRRLAMVGSCWLGFHPSCVLGSPLPRGAFRAIGAGAPAARCRRPFPCGGGRRRASHLTAVVFFPSPLCSLRSCSIEAGRLIGGDRDRRENQQVGRSGQGRGLTEKGPDWTGAESSGRLQAGGVRAPQWWKLSIASAPSQTTLRAGRHRALFIKGCQRHVDGWARAIGLG